MDAFDQACSAAISHIGFSVYSSGKIKKYLLNKGYDIDIAADVVSSLIERGYIDDFKAAGQVLLFRKGKKRESREFSRKRLIEAGIDPDVAYDVVSDLPSDERSVVELFDASLPAVVDEDVLDDLRKKSLILAARRGFSFECAQKGYEIWLHNRHN